ncbi:MAG: S-methyl-5-thioribose-1-phosphate isomerase [Asgard group archaeon]|nr:S-methyl-5-thioribose-1-phosphate isomerase [Asgard group archaeon]
MSFEKICEQILSLEIQGATDVAKAGMRALEERLEEQDPRNKKEAMKILKRSQERLATLRPTEPLLRNALRFILNQAQKAEKVIDLLKNVQNARKNFTNKIVEGKKRIGKIGARRISGVVLTHCHSSTAFSIFSESKKDITQMYVTETRPRYQGRITAKELLEIGLPTIMIVDSAARHFMKEVDYVVVGSDVITSEGNIINKIGTASIALAAHEARIPVYVATSLLKFEPGTILGKLEEIEERDWKEIWKEKPDNLVIKNPAFDVTPEELIDGLITETGIISPQMAHQAVKEIYPWILD